MSTVKEKISIFNSVYSKTFSNNVLLECRIDIDHTDVPEVTKAFGYLILLDEESDINYVEQLLSCNTEDEAKETEAYKIIETFQRFVQGLVYKDCILMIFKVYYHLFKDIR